MKVSFRGLLAAAALVAGLGAARADDATPAQVELAKKVLISVGLKGSMDQIVPAMLGQLQSQLLQIHPEMGKQLHETLVALQPEFNEGEDAVFTDTARAMASRMTEAELKQTLDYFDSPAGKKYVAITPVFLQNLSDVTGAWREKLSTDILERARAAMKKKGVDF